MAISPPIQVKDTRRGNISNPIKNPNPNPPIKKKLTPDQEAIAQSLLRNPANVNGAGRNQAGQSTAASQIGSQSPGKTGNIPSAAQAKPQNSELEVTDAQNQSVFIRPQFRDKTLSEKDAKYQSVGLPSGFMFYSWKALSIRPFSATESRKAFRSRATKGGDIRSLVEAIGSCIDRDVMELTVGDWWALMYWEKLNSYTKHPWLITLECDNPDHNMAVASKEKEERTLKTVHQIDNGMIEPICLDTVQVTEALNRFKQDYGVELNPPRVADMVESMEYQRDTPNVEPDLIYGFRYATLLPRTYGESLLDRLKWMDDSLLPADILQSMEDMAKVFDHGVKESVKLKCDGCGASSVRPLTVDALSFLPDIFGKID